MLTYPKSTMRVRRIPMHLSSGHVTLMTGKFYPPPNFPQSDLGRRADSRWALPQISSLFLKPHINVRPHIFIGPVYVLAQLRRQISLHLCTAFGVHRNLYKWLFNALFSRVCASAISGPLVGIGQVTFRLRFGSHSGSSANNFEQDATHPLPRSGQLSLLPLLR